MVGIELVVGYLVAWVVRKAKRAGGQADAIVDEAMDAGMERLHRLVAEKLGNESAILQMDAEASQSGDVTDRTRTRVALALEEVTETDSTFAAAIQAAAEQVRSTEQTIVESNHGVVIGGNVQIQAKDGAAAAWHIDSVILADRQPDPSQPDRP